MTEHGPIHLEEDAATGDRFLVYDSGKGARLDIRFEGETLWMTQEQIARLFGRERTVITKHIANVFEEGELDEESCVQKMHTTAGRPPVIYNLDVVISVGYRVSSARATLFRRWATGVLVQFAKSGFVVDSVRLKNPANADRIAELRDIIRDIRSDEANVYRELKRICSCARTTIRRPTAPRHSSSRRRRSSSTRSSRRRRPRFSWSARTIADRTWG